MNRRFCSIRAAATVLSLLLLVSCGVSGGTRRIVIDLDPVPPPGGWRPLQVATLEKDEGGVHLLNVGTYPWGKFSDVDQQSLKASLEHTFSLATQGHVSSTLERLNTHIRIRKYVVGTTNSEGFVWIAVDWCVATVGGRVLFQESLFATGAAHSAVTIGACKDGVHYTLLERIARITLATAAKGQQAGIDTSATDALFNEAGEYLPLRKVSPAYLTTGTYATFEDALDTIPMTLEAPAVELDLTHWLVITLTPAKAERVPMAWLVPDAPTDWAARLHPGN